MDQQLHQKYLSSFASRFSYLHLLLYRPIFTQVCTDTRSRTHEADHRWETHSTIYSSILTECAAACVRAAINLIYVVYDTYQPTTTDTWWYNGFCKQPPRHTHTQTHIHTLPKLSLTRTTDTSAVGMVLIMSYTCDPIPSEPDPRTVETAWTQCEEILQQMGTFSLFA